MLLVIEPSRSESSRINTCSLIGELSGTVGFRSGTTWESALGVSLDLC